MFKHYKFENNAMNNCSLKAVTLMILFLPFLLSSFARKKLIIITHLFKKLIYETQNNLYQLTTHMPTLKAHRQIFKKRCFEKYCSVIMHANFKLYRVHPDGVI